LLLANAISAHWGSPKAVLLLRRKFFSQKTLCHKATVFFIFFVRYPGQNILMTEEEEKIIAALENAEATPQQQTEAARIIRDLDRELRELLEWEQRD